MLVSEYIVDYLAKLGIKKVFVLTGGAIAFTIDAFHNRKDIDYVCVAHEQAAAMAADAYSRLGPGIAATMVTSGPGATNLITGICCSWFDSIPVIHISGQVNTKEQKKQSTIRQLGFQETDIVSMVKPITKFAEQLDRPENIRYLLEKATFLAKSGRPGPVLIDIPIDFQYAKINPKKLKSFKKPGSSIQKDLDKNLIPKIKQLVNMLKKSERPLILLGGGVRISGAEDLARTLIEKLNIPFVVSWSGFDLFEKSHRLFISEIGVVGNRGANFAIQNSDLLLTIGSRLDTRQIGGKPELFAPLAKKVFVDIDSDEITKKRGPYADLAIKSDAKVFIEKFLNKIDQKYTFRQTEDWLSRCKNWKSKYPSVNPEYHKSNKPVNPYLFIKTLSDLLTSNSVIIPDDGGNLCWTMQAFELKKGQRLFSSFGNSPMGYSLPASIGASLALSKKEIICIDGDGSIQINIQEFQTIVNYKLPIKIFVINNNGYGIIKQFQDLWLDSRYEATGRGYSCPDFVKVANAYGIKTFSINSHKNLKQKINKVLKYKGAALCNVVIADNQRIIPRLDFGNSIENLTPALSKKEYLENMTTKPEADNKT